MIENVVKSIQELNQVAGYLRKSQEFDRIRKLAYTWLVPEEYAEDFITGKRCLLADADIEEKEYPGPAAKLAEEMGILSDEYFADIIGAYICRKCSDESYAALVMQHHKTLQKCLDYILGKVYAFVEKKKGKEKMRNRQGGGIAMSSAVIFSWAEEYYRLDDAKEEAEKKKRAQEEYYENRARQEKQKEEQAIREKEWKEREKKREARAQEKKEQEKAARAQLSLFDLVTDPLEKCGQEEGMES